MVRKAQAGSPLDLGSFGGLVFPQTAHSQTSALPTTPLLGCCQQFMAVI